MSADPLPYLVAFAARQLPVAFDCSRTCPLFERVDLCRFNALLRAAGVVQTVNSHTVRVNVEFKDTGALGSAAEHIGGRSIGSGIHKLFAEEIAGFAVHLKDWRYPIVATDSGAIAYDHYNGRWGSENDVNRLRAEYSVQAAKATAERLGWLTERNSADGLVIYHPNGGTLTVDATGSVDANGFHGVGCHEAAGVIGSAIGKPAEFIAKPEFYENAQQISELE